MVIKKLILTLVSLLIKNNKWMENVLLLILNYDLDLLTRNFDKI